MKLQRWLQVCLLLMIVMLLAACSGSDEGDIDDYAEPPMEEYEAGGFEGQTFNFSMTAELGQLLQDAVSDSMESEWTGTFTVDEGGIIHGSGSAFFNAAIFNTEEGCGYVWYENADFDFTTTGQAQQQDGAVELSFVVDLASEISPHRTEPTATCDDPGEWRLSTPEIYFDMHRDTMLSDIQLGVARLGPRIQLGQTLEAETGGVSYTILVDLAAVPLTD